MMGLQSVVGKELNGRTGHIISIDPKAGRYGVELFQQGTYQIGVAKSILPKSLRTACLADCDYDDLLDKQRADPMIAAARSAGRAAASWGQPPAQKNIFS